MTCGKASDGFKAPVKLSALGYRRWQLDHALRGCFAGVPWECPALFRTDLYSAPWLVRSVAPVSLGISDSAAVLHDFVVRCRRLLGLSLLDCHRLFYRAMRSTGTCRLAAWSKYSAVFLCNWLVAGPGDGTTRAPLYSGPVGSRVKCSLPEWCAVHYRPDGSGWRPRRTVE